MGPAVCNSQSCMRVRTIQFLVYEVAALTVDEHPIGWQFGSWSGGDMVRIEFLADPFEIIITIPFDAR